MFGFGAIGAMATGESDIAEVMFLQGLIIPAVISLGLNIWTTNDNAKFVSVWDLRILPVKVKISL